MALNLSRNTRCWVSTALSGAETNANTFEIGIQDGYSYGAQPNSSDITLNEAGATPNRGSKRFNDSINPVDWSFATYIRPYVDTNHYLADALLWHALATGESMDLADTAKSVHGALSVFNISFENNSYHELQKIRVIFKIDNMYIIINDAQVSQAEIAVDIDGIGQVSWSGQGTTYETLTVAPAFIAANGFQAQPVGAKYLKSKLSALTLSHIDPAVTYDIAITGASFTINNNITYLTPETLGQVDEPIGSFTGTFEATGSLQCYLNTKTNGSAQLQSALQADKSVSNSYALTLSIGSTTGTGARLEVMIPNAHLSIPETSIDDVIGMSLDFRGIPSSGELNDGDEISLSAYAV